MGSDSIEKQQRREVRTMRLTILSTIVLFSFVLLLFYALYIYVFIPVADIVSPLEDGTARLPKIPREKRDQHKHLFRTIKVRNDYGFDVSLFHENIEEHGEHSLIGDYLDDVSAGATVSLQTLLGDVIFATEINGIRRLEEFKVITKRNDLYVLGSKNYASSIFDPSMDVDKIKSDISKEMIRVRDELSKLAERSGKSMSNLEMRKHMENVDTTLTRDPDLKFDNKVFDRDFSHLLEEKKDEVGGS